MPVRPQPQLEVPSPHNWRTTDEDEINRRRARAQQEEFRIINNQPRHPIFSNFRAGSPSGMTYSVEIRALGSRQFACECVDFRINGLGTCKHVEAVLLDLQGRFKRLFQAAEREGSTRIDIVPDPVTDSIRLLNGHGPLPRALREWFDTEGVLRRGPVAGRRRLVGRSPDGVARGRRAFGSRPGHRGSAATTGCA